MFHRLAETSEMVAATSKRNDKVAALAAVLGDLDPDEISPAAAFLTGATQIGRIGVGWSSLQSVRVDAVNDATLLIGDVDDVITRLAGTTGSGSVGARHKLLTGLFMQATDSEQRLLYGILGGGLRQGALDGVVTTAVAKAAAVPVGAVRRAAMMAGGLPPAAFAALTGGREALDAVHLEALRPVQPMLASPSPTAADAVGEMGAAVVEWKLDGARVQAHRRGNEIRLFTRNLNDITDRLPGVVRTVSELDGGDLVLDGEVMGFLVRDSDDDDTLESASPRRFQDTMGDFGANPGEERGTDLRAFFFDIMFLDGRPVHDEPYEVRRRLLVEHVPAASRLPSLTTDNPSEAQQFMDDAVAAGHEGVVVKALDAPYEAGRRGAGWRKVKPVHTFDLVVLGVEWGHGRRTGLLSNLHLGARALDGTFVMVGKTFKGLTDELLRWQTERFLELRDDDPSRPTERGRNVVHVRPEQVVEIAIDGVQASTKYPGGVALRFARVKRYRDDKSVAEADTIEALQSML